MLYVLADDRPTFANQLNWKLMINVRGAFIYSINFKFVREGPTHRNWRLFWPRLLVSTRLRSHLFTIFQSIHILFIIYHRWIIAIPWSGRAGGGEDESAAGGGVWQLDNLGAT